MKAAAAIPDEVYVAMEGAFEAARLWVGANPRR
jgi:hypothetical protein